MYAFVADMDLTRTLTRTLAIDHELTPESALTTLYHNNHMEFCNSDYGNGIAVVDFTIYKILTFSINVLGLESMVLLLNLITLIGFRGLD
jgi:hypothetical protein